MTWQSPCLLPMEAVSYLRLDTDREAGAALAALDRLVERRLLAPCLVGKHKRYHLDELNRFLRDATEKYRETHP